MFVLPYDNSDGDANLANADSFKKYFFRSEKFYITISKLMVIDGSMLLGTLGAGLLGNLLLWKGILRAIN